MKKRYVLGVLFVLAISVAYLSLPRTSRTNKAESIAALSLEVGLSFPPSTRLLGVRRANGMDDLVKFKVQMKAEDVPAFLSAAQVDPGAMTTGAVAYFGTDREFWDPQRAAGLRGVQIRREKTFRTLNIGTSEPRDGVVDVYVMEHGD